MRQGARHNAITNSPFVRALLKPVFVTLPPQPLLPPPSAGHLIPTQPGPLLPTPPPSAAGSVASTKRKRDADDDGEERGVVEVSYTAQNLPDELRKYWAQRYRLFSLFDEGCQMDLEGWYSVTPEYIAAQIAERCRCGVVVDAFCGVGGNAIQFAFTCEKVIAIDNSPTRLACAKHNAEIYGVADRIEFILADFPSWSKDYVARLRAGTVPPDDQVEVVFLSPPWGGIDYRELAAPEAATGTSTPVAKRLKAADVPSTPTPALPKEKPAYPLVALGPLPGNELFALARAMTSNVAYYLPRNVDIEEVARLPEVAPREGAKEGEVERVEVEEEWMGGKMKAVTVYYGDLAVGT